jgi:hypothetical protein
MELLVLSAALILVCATLLIHQAWQHRQEQKCARGATSPKQGWVICGSQRIPVPFHKTPTDDIKENTVVLLGWEWAEWEE